MKALSDFILKAGGQAVVAHRMGVSRAAVWKWQRANQVPPKRAVLAAHLFGVRPEEICGFFKGASDVVRGESL